MKSITNLILLFNNALNILNEEINKKKRPYYINLSNIILFPLVIIGGIAILYCFSSEFFNVSTETLQIFFNYFTLIIFVNSFAMLHKYIFTPTSLFENMVIFLSALKKDVTLENSFSTCSIYLTLFCINMTAIEKIALLFQEEKLSPLIATIGAFILSFVVFINAPASKFTIIRRKFYISCLSFLLAFIYNLYQLSQLSVTDFKNLAFISIEYITILIAMAISFDQTLAYGRQLLRITKKDLRKLIAQQALDTDNHP